MWGYDLMKSYPDYIEFVGLCDKNEGRVETGKKIIGASCPTYTDFEKMMKETRPDVLIVTTMDSTHHHFIIRGMELGADIITEKPMTTDEKKIQAILDAEKRTGKNCRVTFNYRYSPHRAKIWELLRAGEIGDITSVDFHWYLDTSHGADYFRRWHRLVECSGSLWVHKASHHFDLLIGGLTVIRKVCMHWAVWIIMVRTERSGQRIAVLVLILPNVNSITI